MTFLPANGTFDPKAAIGYLQRHAIRGVEVVDVPGRRVTRLLRTGDGVVAVELVLSRDGVDVATAAAGGEPPADVIALVRGWFDLCTDLDTVGQVLDGDPALAAIGRAFPGLRVTGFPDGFEGAITTVLGQQVSVAAARTFAGRLAAAYGTAGPAGLTLFPSPERLTAVPVEELRAAVGVPGERARTLHAVAELFAGGFRLEPACASTGISLGPSTGSGHEDAGSGHEDAGSGPGAAARAALLAVPGIGPWTVEYLAMRVLHDPDACPAGDLVLRRALRADRPAEVLARAERWRPYRAYAVVRLWTAAIADPR